MMQFLFEGTGRKGISPGNLSELLDAFPLEKIPVEEARRRYDNEIYDYLTQETRSEESDDGLIYRIFDVNAERIRLAIKDADTPFEGLTACIRTDDTRRFYRVEADGYVDARGETFSLSSRDGSLLPVSGKIVAPDGTELAYAASASNKEISVTRYDTAEIAWLHALAEAGTGVRIGSAELSTDSVLSLPTVVSCPLDVGSSVVLLLQAAMLSSIATASRSAKIFFIFRSSSFYYFVVCEPC